MEEDAQMSAWQVSMMPLMCGAVVWLCCLLLYPAAGYASDALPGIDRMQGVEVSARKYLKRTVEIPGGHYTEPFIVKTADTEYLLMDDIVADGTAIAVRAPRVVLNLNGKTITYNQSKPGEGVVIDAYHTNDVAIINGTIVQGAAQSEGDVYGAGNNPIKSLGVARLQIAGVSARYGGRDVNGFYLRYVGNGIVENCVLEDTWDRGTMKNRHQGKTAIGIGEGAVVRNNTIINARQGGVGTGNNSEIYGNTISINSMVTNSAGVGGYKARNIKVHHNTITGRGEHPLGIAFVSAGTDSIEVYNNTIDLQTTRLGDEYAAAGGNYAAGFRTTWGGNNINFHDNTITVRTDSAYPGTRSSTGEPVVVNAKGRGLMVAVNAGEKARFYNNTITVLDKDGSGKAFGIACTGGNAGEMVFEGNRVTSNILNVALGDEYGACSGHPLFVRNTFVKTDNYPGYKTVAAEYGGYFEGTGRFVSNSYEAGASQSSVILNAGNKSHKSVGFGREISAELLKSDGKPDVGATLKMENGSPLFDVTAITDADGKATLVVYDYELHNRASKTEQRRVLAPHTIRVVSGADQLVTRTDSQTEAWDALMATGNHELPLYTEASGVRAGILKIFYNTGKVLR